MSGRKVAWAISLVRWWTRVYTTGLPPEQRRARQEEIDSDLWEQAREEEAVGSHRTALQILGRMLLGALEDLTWRVEQISEIGETAGVGRTWAMTGTFGRVLLGTLWLLVGAWQLYRLVPSAVRGFTEFELQGAIASFLPVLLLSAGVLLTGLALLLRRIRARLATLVFAPLLVLYGAGGIASSLFYLLNFQQFQQRDPELTWLTPLGIAASSTLLVVLGVWALWLVLSKDGRGALIRRTPSTSGRATSAKVSICWTIRCLLLYVPIVLISCSPQLGGRWEISIEGAATEDGVLELQMGANRASVDVPKGQEAVVVRDRLTAQLRNLGYSVDCFWSSPSRTLKVENGTPVPVGDDYYFVTWPLPASPEIKRLPQGIGVGARGPRLSVDREADVVERAALRWMEEVEEGFELPSNQRLGAVAIDTELSALLEDLRAKGQSLTFGRIGEINVECNQATVQLVSGLIAGILLERGDDEKWRVSGVQSAE